jgi:6-phosphogluconolactonase
MNRIAVTCLFLAAIAAAAFDVGQAALAQASPSGETLVYVGTYTRDTASKGIYRLRRGADTGKLSAPELAAEVENPSFLTIHPERRTLYAVSETRGTPDQPGGRLTAFSIDGMGALARLNDQSTGAPGPVFASVTKDSTAAVVANYSGSVASFPISADGSLQPAASIVKHEGSSVDPKRQQGPHAHSVNVDPADRFALVADLGLDRVLVYTIDHARGSIERRDPGASVTPGSGPRHLAFHPNGRVAYLINELTSTVTVFAWDASAGTLKELQTLSALPPGFSGTSYTAEIQVHPSGRFVYGSNRGHDSIAIFAADRETGRLTLAGHEPTGGDWPRHFGIDPTGRILIAATQRSNSLVVFRIDEKTGRLAATGTTVEVAAPVCVKFFQPVRESR